MFSTPQKGFMLLIGNHPLICILQIMLENESYLKPPVLALYQSVPSQCPARVDLQMKGWPSLQVAFDWNYWSALLPYSDSDDSLVVYLPLWKIWKSVGIMIPNIFPTEWKNNMFQTTNHFWFEFWFGIDPQHHQVSAPRLHQRNSGITTCADQLCNTSVPHLTSRCLEHANLQICVVLNNTPFGDFTACQMVCENKIILLTAIAIDHHQCLRLGKHPKYQVESAGKEYPNILLVLARPWGTYRRPLRDLECAAWSVKHWKELPQIPEQLNSSGSGAESEFRTPFGVHCEIQKKHERGKPFWKLPPWEGLHHPFLVKFWWKLYHIRFGHSSGQRKLDFKYGYGSKQGTPIISWWILDLILWSPRSFILTHTHITWSRNEVTHYLQQINGTSGQRQVFLDGMVYFLSGNIYMCACKLAKKIFIYMTLIFI